MRGLGSQSLIEEVSALANVAKTVGSSVRERVARHSAEYLLGKGQPGTSQLPIGVMQMLERIFKGYPRATLKPDVARLLDSNKDACRIKANYILPHLNGAPLEIRKTH